jgi:hypothetical protein
MLKKSLTAGAPLCTARVFWPAFLIALGLWPSADHRLAAQVKPQTELWLAIGVARPVFQLAEAATLQVSFAVVNDRDTIADPGIGSSHLFINGTEPNNDWRFVINNGIRTSYFAALPSGSFLSFSHQLGPRYFAKHGIYNVRWQARNFRSTEMTFRVMPGGR